RDLDDAGDTEVAEGLHAQVPAHRVAHLADDPPQDLRAGVDDLAVDVGHERNPGVVGGDGPGESPEVVGRGGHVLGVEGTGDLEGHDPSPGRRLLTEGGELFEGAGGDDLAGTVDVGGGEAVRLD